MESSKDLQDGKSDERGVDNSMTILQLSSKISSISVDLNMFMNKLAKINPQPKMVGEIGIPT